ncbi:phage portal protein [Marininema halotolerans]|uniref:Phage portal protein, HK97 family n=1 Tax=Marininema halotolerans TaxID=1155944 RepID=A0A1I6URY8_9BACL|nr:phage portal protein [Marininema halotolerans]SFT04160.1 phage portal protein, HK97 family [Marininema halotolerans]
MGIWGRIRGIFSSEKRSYSGQGYDFTRWFEPRNIFVREAADSLASNETIFAAINRLSNAMGSLPVKLYKDFDPVYSKISDLVSNSPNSNLTSFDFIRTLEVQRNTYGNAYAMKDYGTNFQVEALHLIDPSCVTPVLEEKTKVLWYEIEGDKGRYYVHNMDMIHLKHIHSQGFKGIKPVDVLRRTLEFDAEVRTFTMDQMDGAVKASFLLKMESNFSRDKKKEILDGFKSFYRENGGVLLQESGTEISPIERKFLDTKVFEVENITRSRVAAVFNLPLFMLGGLRESTTTNREQESLEFVQGTLMPIVRQYEQEFNRKLLTDRERSRGLGFKFNMNALLRADTRTRGEFYFKNIRSGVFTPNEVRAWEELPPLPGGEKLYMSRDLSPINDPTRGKEVMTQDVPTDNGEVKG